MKNRDIFIVAMRNLRAGKEMTRKMVFGMMFVTVLMLSSVSVIQSFYYYTDDYNKNHIADCYFSIMFENSEISEAVLDNYCRQSKVKQQEYNAEETSILCTLGLKDADWNLAAENLGIVIDDKEYSVENYTFSRVMLHQNIQYGSSEIDIALYSNELSLFSKRLTDEYDGTCLVGRYPEKPGEIMLDTYILKSLGIDDYSEQMIGKSVCILYNGDEESDAILEEYTLSGILKENFISKKESKTAYDSHLEHIYVNLRTEDMERFVISNGSMRFYFYDYSEFAKNYKYMDRLIQMNISELKNNDDSSDVILSSLGMEYCLLYWIMNNIGKLLLIVVGIMVLIVTFSVLYIFEFYRNRNSKYISMLQNIGMKQRDRRKLLFTETSVIALMATMLGIYFTVIILMLTNFVTKLVMNFSIHVNVVIEVLTVCFIWAFLLLLIFASETYKLKRGKNS